MIGKPLPPPLMKKSGPPMKPPMNSQTKPMGKGESPVPLKNLMKPKLAEKISKPSPVEKGKMMPPMKIQNPMIKLPPGSPMKQEMELKIQKSVNKEIKKSENYSVNNVPVESPQMNKDVTKTMNKVMNKLNSFIKISPEPTAGAATTTTTTTTTSSTTTSTLMNQKNQFPPMKSEMPKSLLKNPILTKESTKTTLEKTMETKNGVGKVGNNIEFRQMNSNANRKREEESSKANNIEDNKHVINHITVNNTNMENNIMLGIMNDSRTVGPLSTFKDSELIRNNHYINAFSKINGDYIGKVSGPPCPISILDKTPQSLQGKKPILPLSTNTQNNIPLTVPQDMYGPFHGWFNGTHNNGMFKYFDNLNPQINSMRVGAGGGMPYCFYPGMCVPMMPCSSWDFSNPNAYMQMMNPYWNGGGENNEADEEAEKEANLKKKKKQKHKLRNEGKMIASGHLKPMQYKYGTQWSSEDEKYINAEIDLDEHSNESGEYDEREKRKKKMKKEQEYDAEEEEEETKSEEEYQNNKYGRMIRRNQKSKKNEKKNNRKVKTIGNSHWYEIEHRLNNARGEIEEDDEDSTYDRNYSGQRESSDEEYVKWKRNKKKMKGELQKQQRYKHGRKKYDDYCSDTHYHSTDEESNVGDLYGNYKAKYLKEKLQWANEYIKNKKKQKHELINQTVEYSPLKKKHLKRIEDIANLFLPKNKKYQNLSDLAGNLSKISVSDQSDVINLLLSCRELEKTIEEQHCVLDMLDYDLKEVNSNLKLPPNWDVFENIDLLNDHMVNPEEKYLPSNNSPMFIKGRVALVPKNMDTFFEDQEKPSMNHVPKNMPTDTHTNTNTNNFKSAANDATMKMQKRVKFLPKVNPKMKTNAPIFKKTGT